MPALMPDQVDDFVQAVIHKYEKMRWEDISLPLQEYYFASRIFNKAKAEEMSGDLLEFKLQYQNPGNFGVIGLYQVDIEVDWTAEHEPQSRAISFYVLRSK